MASPYDIAIRISMENAVSPVLAIIAKDMLGLSMSAKKLEESFAKMGLGMKAMLGAAGIAAVGYEGVKVALDLANHGEKLLHQQNVMLRNGLSFNEVTNLTADAYERITKQVPTAAASDALRTISELRSVLGDTTAAVNAAPFALKLDAIIGNLTGQDTEGAGFSLWRALEMKGLTVSDPQQASKLAETMAEIISASNGKVTADLYQAFAKRAGAAWMTASSAPDRRRRFGPDRRHGRRHGWHGILDVLQQRHGRGADVAAAGRSLSRRWPYRRVERSTRSRAVINFKWTPAPSRACSTTRKTSINGLLM